MKVEQPTSKKFLTPNPGDNEHPALYDIITNIR